MYGTVHGYSNECILQVIQRKYGGLWGPAGRIMKWRVLVVDDHPATRMGVCTLVASSALLEVCGEASDGLEAIEKVADLCPDAVVLDLTMPIMSGFEAALKIKRILPSAKIVFFTMHDVPASVRIIGADAFVVKTSAPETLVAALERVLQHGRITGSGIV